MKFKNNPFVCDDCEIEGKSNWDESYLKRTIVQAVKKTGDSDTDFVVVDKVIEDHVDIREYIQSQASTCGVEYYLKRCMAGLDTLQDVTVTDEVVDVSNAPTSLMEVKQLSDNMNANFSKLPSDLVNGLSMEEFLSKVTPDDIIKYYANKAAENNTGTIKEEDK